MFKNDNSRTPLRKMRQRLNASSDSANHSRMYDEEDDDDDTLMNDISVGFHVPHPVEQHTGILLGTLRYFTGNKSKEETKNLLDTIHQLIMKIIKEHGGTSGGSKPSDQFLSGFDRSFTIYALHDVIRVIIKRVDSAEDKSIESKCNDIFNNVFHLFNLMVASDTREISIKIVKAIIDSLDTEGCAKMFCDGQAGENRIGYAKHFPNEESAVEANNFVAKSYFFPICKILPAYLAIGDEYKNKTVTLIVNLAGRIQQNRFDFFIAGAVEKAGKLVMISCIDNTFLSAAHVKDLMTMMVEITHGAANEATIEADGAAAGAAASAINGTF